VGGLDYIVANGGTITDAVSSMKWSGDAVVFVSIVNWVKGVDSSRKRLSTQEGNDPSKGWSASELDNISASLSFALDVTQASTIRANAALGGCFQGQTHGHEGFLLENEEAQQLKAKDPKNAEVLYPFLIANELVGAKDSLPTRHVIDFYPRGLLEAQDYKELFSRVQKLVLPDREKAAKEEDERNKEALADNPKAKINRHHANFLNKWWGLSYPREDMLTALGGLSRYIACGRVTARPIFEFISPSIRPNDALMVFPFEDDYSFGILQSGLHWEWFKERCSTLKGDPRYTSNTVFDSFPWPQQPTLKAVQAVADAAIALRKQRRADMKAHGLSLRELYRTLDLPGSLPVKDAHEDLDESVRAAYGMTKSDGVLPFLLALNREVADQEDTLQSVQGPGLPAIAQGKNYISSDRLLIEAK
jgi:hypothetical protein